MLLATLAPTLVEPGFALQLGKSHKKIKNDTAKVSSWLG